MDMLKHNENKQVPGQVADLLAKLRKWGIYLLGRPRSDRTTNSCRHD